MDRGRTEPDIAPMFRRILIAAGLLLLVVDWRLCRRHRLQRAHRAAGAGRRQFDSRHRAMELRRAAQAANASRRATAHRSTTASIPVGTIARWSCWCTARRAPTPRCSSSPRRCRRPAPPSTRSACAAMAAAARPTATSPTSVSSTTIWPTWSKVSASTSRACIARSIGFSSGGGFVLRIAGGKQAGLFNDYLAISPYIGQDSPTNKPNSGGWAGVAVPRIIALSLLDGARPAVVPGPARRPLRHRRQGRATAARRSTPSGWRQACSSAATGAACWRAYRRPPRSWSAPTTSCSTPISSSRCCKPINPRIGVTIVPNADPSRHDRRSSSDGRHRRRLAKVGRRLTSG